MDIEHGRWSDEDPAIVNLARKSHIPVGDVEQLYENELSKLNIGAHIKGFLSIFALRNVCKILRNRSVTKPPLVKPGSDPESGHPARRNATAIRPAHSGQAIASRSP